MTLTKRLLLVLSPLLLTLQNASGVVINNIGELDAAAEFSFSIISDNKTNGTGDTRTNRAITWIKANDEFCFGLGDNMKNGASTDGFDNVLRSDNWWHNNFYPHIGDGECQAYGGSQGAWPNGANFFKEVNNWNGRSNVHQNTLEPLSSNGYRPSYYAEFNNVKGSGINIHLISGAWSDSRALDNATRDFIWNKVNELGATKTDNDIIMILGHDNGGWVSKVMTSGKFNESQVSFLIDTVDFIGDASSHSHGRHITGDSKFEETPSNAIKTQLTQPGAALWMNSGHVKSQATSRYGYLQFHVFSNPTRMTVQYLNLDNGTRQLHTPGMWGGNSNFRDPVMKEINGPITYVNWNNFNIGPIPNGAEFVSQSGVPTIMNPGETRAVSITMKNTGADTWTTAAGHALGAQNPQGNNTWTGINRVGLTQNVAPGQNYTFTFNITAPSTPGAYNFQWRMVDDVQPNQSWFGDHTQNVSIGVGIVSASFTVSDDTEELIANGNIAGSSDLEFIYDDAHMNNAAQTNGDQIVGLRFSNVTIPQGVVVSNAYIQFTGDAANAGSGNAITLNIAGHDINNSSAFTEGDTFDLSNRLNTAKTSANVNWSPPAWGNGASGSAERSPNISTIVQEIVGRGGWSSGNSLSIIISGTTGLGSAARRAEALEGAGGAAVLHVEYGTGNQDPVFTSSPDLYADAGSFYSYSINTNDPDGDPVSLSTVTKPSWLNLSGSTLSGTPSAVNIGSHNVTLRANDGTTTVDQSFTIQVSAAGNDAPVINSSPANTAIESQSYNYTIVASDADGDSLSYSQNNLPTWMNLNGNVLSGTPSAAHLGSHTVSISVSDGSDSIDQDFTVVVFEQPAASNLVLNGSFENGGANPEFWTMGNAAVGSTDTTAAGNGNSALKITNNSSPTKQVVALQQNTDYVIRAWILASGVTAGNVVLDTNDVFDPGQVPGGTGQFVANAGSAGVWTQFTGNFNSSTETSVTIRIFGTGTMLGTAYVDNVVVVEASGGNAAPVITSSAGTEAQEGDNYSYTIMAVDLEGDTLTYSHVQKPAWLNLSGNILSGTPGSGDVGSNSVTVRVSDGGNNVDQSFNINVTALPNDPPSWSAGNFTAIDADEGQAYVYSVSNRASDPDGDSLTFNKEGGTADWASVSSNGMITGTPGASDLGFNTVVISVTDGNHPVVNTVVSINVIAAPVTDPLQIWMSNNSIVDEMADDDGDGIINLLEFAVGGDPNSEDAGSMSPTVNTDGANVDITFKRQESSVTYVIQKSTDLVNWSDHITVTDSHGLVGNDATVSVANNEMSNGKLFLRLKVNTD